MKQYPAIIAALPREVSALVKGWDRRQLADHIFVYTRGNAVVACAGMGAARAELAVRAAMDAMPVTALISVGLAGACEPALRVGEIVRAGIVIDRETGERFEDSRFRRVLVTTNLIAGVGEKARLRRLYQAEAVDMEAAAVARMARALGLQFRAIKAISDEADFAVEGLSEFATADGQFRENAFAMHAVVRPALWGKVIALGRKSSKALAALTGTLQGELDWLSRRD